MKKRVISGVQATGSLHLGNYSEIKRWVPMQDSYESLFFIADLHAITIPKDPEELRNSTLSVAAAYLACGFDPNKATIFIQSSVHEHSELAWLLNCMAPIGWLSRMTQFKDKAGKDRESASTGLFTYPVLMAADILAYEADLVPVGEDQKQHLELTRDIAGAVNRKFNKQVLTVPEPFIAKEGARLKSLRDGTKKMSKSDPSDQSRINLSDDADTIYQKFKKAKTDNIAHISYEESRPEIANLLTIYAMLSGRSIDSIVTEYETNGFAKFKEDLANLAVSTLGPITTSYNHFLADKAELLAILRKGSEHATKIASKTLRKLKDEFGFVV